MGKEIRLKSEYSENNWRFAAKKQRWGEGAVSGWKIQRGHTKDRGDSW